MMSSSRPRTGLLRVLRDDHDHAATPAFARWQPSQPSGGHSPGLRIDPFEAARHSGFQEGYLAARAEADTEVDGDRHRVRSALAAAATSVAATRVEAVAAVTAEVVALAIDLAEAFLQRELTLGDSVDIAAVSRALHLAPGGEDLVVRLHPDHANESAEIDALAPGVTIKVIEDPSIEHGGCVLEAGPCRIDTQVGPAMARARALIAGSAPIEDDQP
jgi:flagellar assembly protein FliH